MEKNLKKLPFTSAERELIVALVRERPIIEDKRTNAKNIELKKHAWEDLAVAYNAQPFVSQRNSLQLKRCWENIKTQRKKELSDETNSFIRTGGGPPEGGPSASSVVDEICPFINLRVPGVIDSNTIEDVKIPELEVEKDIDIADLSDQKIEKKSLKRHFEDIKVDTNQPKRKFLNEMLNTPRGHKSLKNETEMRMKRCNQSIQNDQVLHELRTQREKILMERELNLLEYEKEIHILQTEKLKLEIEILKKQLTQ